MGIRGDIKDEDINSLTLSSFAGGMRRNVDPSVLDDTEYVHGQNIRIRDGYIRPIKLPTDISSELPAGKKQGIYGYGSILVVFNQGLAYGRDLSLSNSQFNLVNGFLMSDSVDRIYAQDVPASWLNVQRKLDDETDITSGISFLSEISGTPAAIVCQDGVSQPRLIFSVGNARPAKTSQEWENTTDANAIDTREYVPIGKQMMYHPDGQLLIISPDGKELYRSVSGRPLDFIVAVDVNGNKLPPLTSGKPEASRLSYNLDYTPLSAIFNVNSTPRRDLESSGFYVGTQLRSWLVFPSYQYTPFNEPTFNNQTLFSTGPLNQDSVIEISGDTAIITEAGPLTFNSILNTRTEGKNSPFYRKIAKLFEKITQTTTCVGRFDDYTLFSVNTIYGQGVLVYDNLHDVFPSLDIYPKVSGVIKQFAEIKVNGIKKLYFITTGDQLFEAFTGDTANWIVVTKEAASNAEVELIPRRFKISLANILEDGVLTVQEFVDRKAGTERTEEVEANAVLNTPPLTIPYGASTEDSVKGITFTLDIPLKGEQVGIMIKGDFDCELQRVQMIFEADEQAITDGEKGSIFRDIQGSL